MIERVNIFLDASPEKKEAVVETDRLLYNLTKDEKFTTEKFEGFMVKSKLSLDEINSNAIVVTGHNTGLIIWFNSGYPYAYGLVDSLLLEKDKKRKIVHEIYDLKDYPAGEARRWFAIMELFDNMGLPLFLDGKIPMKYRDIWKVFRHTNQLKAICLQNSPSEKEKYVEQFITREKYEGTILQIWNFDNFYIVRYQPKTREANYVIAPISRVFYNRKFIDSYTVANGYPIGALNSYPVLKIIQKEKISIPIKNDYLTPLLKQLQDEKLVNRWI